MLTYILLLILIIIIIIYLKKISRKQLTENFIDFLDTLSNIIEPNHILPKNKIQLYKEEDKSTKDIEINKPIQKKETKYKYIYIVNSTIINSAYPGDFKYIFYDNKRNNYMILKGNLKNKNEIKLFDIKDTVVGGLLYERYNNFIFYLDIAPYNNNNINIEFYNNYKNVKVYFDNDNKEFYINRNNSNKFKTNKNLYDIYLFKNKHIGKIDGGKITVYEDYKKYLNAFGITYILFENY